MPGIQTINADYYCLQSKPSGPISVLTTNSYVVGHYDEKTGGMSWHRVVLATQRAAIENWLQRHFPPKG
jgi:hypothetical protein